MGDMGKRDRARTLVTRGQCWWLREEDVDVRPAPDARARRVAPSLGPCWSASGGAGLHAYTQAPDRKRKMCHKIIKGVHVVSVQIKIHYYSSTRPGEPKPSRPSPRPLVPGPRPWRDSCRRPKRSTDLIVNIAGSMNRAQMLDPLTHCSNPPSNQSPSSSGSHQRLAFPLSGAKSTNSASHALPTSNDPILSSSPQRLAPPSVAIWKRVGSGS